MLILNQLRGSTPELPSTEQLASRDRMHVQCGNPQCSRSWLAFLKDRRRPVFEGRWGCCGSCVGALVDASIRRESVEVGVAQDQSRHRHRMPLGMILLEQGMITNPQLQRALECQRRAGSGRIGDWLIAECGLTQGHITRALSLQWGCPVLSTDGFDPNAMALAVPRLFMDTLGIVPIRIAGKQLLYLAFVDQLDASAALAMERMSGLKVRSCLTDPVDWAAARQRLSACDVVDATFEQVADTDAMARKIKSTLTGLQPRASHLVRMHQFYWLRMWFESGSMSTRDGGVPVNKEDVADRIYSIAAEQ